MALHKDEFSKIVTPVLRTSLSSLTWLSSDEVARELAWAWAPVGSVRAAITELNSAILAVIVKRESGFIGKTVVSGFKDGSGLNC